MRGLEGSGRETTYLLVAPGVKGDGIAMTAQPKSKRLTWRLATVLAAPAVLLATGCQVEMAGVTLPSPWYLTDDVQYYAPAPSEFKLSREAAALQEQAQAIESERQEAAY
jgi:hypothetical protein